MNDYQRLQDYLFAKALNFDKWLTRNRHLTLAQRQRAWTAFCEEVKPIAHDLTVYEASLGDGWHITQAEIDRNRQEWRQIG